MARIIPLVTARALERASSDDALILLATIAHPFIDGPIRLANDLADWAVDGVVWRSSAFSLDLLGDGDAPPTARFAFPAVDRAALTRLAGVEEPARVDFQVWSAAAFDLSAEPRTATPGATPVYAARRLALADVTVDAATCSGTLRSWDYRQEAWPNLRATQARAPGAWS